MPKLTKLQAAFVQHYLASPGMNAVEAAIAAGYTKATARYASRDILTKPLVAEAVRKAQTRRAKRVGDSAEKVLADIERIGAAAYRAGKFEAALRSAELRGRHLGMFRERVEHTGPGGGPIEQSLTVTFVKP